MTDDFEKRETIAAPSAPYRSSPSIHEALEESWTQPDVVAKTGMRGLDANLRGGMRRGECIALAGSAGHGKSSLAIQLAIEAARSGGVAIYCTVEMPSEEIIARAIAREMFAFADPSGGDWAVGFGDVLIGQHQRPETFTSEPVQTEVMERYIRAREVLHREVYPRLIVQQLAPGATIGDVGELVAKVRAHLAFDGLVVLVVDPLQRLFATARGARTGHALESVNANETERMGAVVQELKQLADSQNLAAVFTSDTTKASAAGDAVGDGLELRGSYQLAHLATCVLTLRAGPDAGQLADRVKGIAGALDADAILRGAPSWLKDRTDAMHLGARYAFIHCAKNRRGPPQSFAMGFIPGAGLFVDGDADAVIAPSKGSSPPKAKKAKKGITVAVKLSPMVEKHIADAIIASTSPAPAADADEETESP